MALKTSTLEKHFSALRKIEEHRTAQSERNIRRIYKALLQDLRKFIGVEYATLAEDDKLTYEILQKKGQYARFLEEFERRINNITPEVSAEIKQLVENMYDISYKGMVGVVEKNKSLKDLKQKLEGIKNVTPEVIRAAIENPVAGLTLSDTLEKNRKEIIYNIKRDVTAGLLNGDRMSSMAKRIAGSVEQNYRKSVLIARTEVHRVREAGHHDAATELDSVMKNGKSSLRMVKTWRTMKDERVRKTSKANHRKLDGVSVGMDEEFDLGHGVKAKAPGQSGKAQHDCNCRCYLSYDLKEIAPQKVAVNLDKIKTTSGMQKLFRANEDWFTRVQYYEGGPISTSSKQIKLGKIDVESAKAFYRGLDNMFERLPKLKGRLSGFVAEDLDSNLYGQCAWGNRISINQKIFNNAKSVLASIKTDINAGFHPKGTACLENTIIHEYGHHIDYLLWQEYRRKGFTGDQFEFRNMLLERVLGKLGVEKRHIGSEVSRYATQNEAEWFAECFTEGMLSENPRRMAKAFMEELEKIIDEEFDSPQGVNEVWRK